MSEIRQARIYHYELPLNQALPLKGSVLHSREGLIVELVSTTGRYGYGEAAPLPDFSAENLGDAFLELKHRCRNSSSDMRQMNVPSADIAFDLALWSLQIDDWLPKPVEAPLLLGEIDRIQERLSRWSGQCPSEFKFKVGRHSVEEDISRVQSVLKYLPDNCKLRLDANQRWTLHEAIEFGVSMDPFRIAYVEEPTLNAQEFEVFHEITGLYFALDESIQNSAYEFNALKGLIALVLKPTLVGGLRRCSELVHSATRKGVRVVMSSSFESDLGIHLLQQLSACWTPGEKPGFDTQSVFSDKLMNTVVPAGQPLSQSTRDKMTLLWQI